jgi:hypothetical protein
MLKMLFAVSLATFALGNAGVSANAAQTAVAAQECDGILDKIDRGRYTFIGGTSGFTLTSQRQLYS